MASPTAMSNPIAYLATYGGLLKILQMGCGFPSFFMLTSNCFNRKQNVFVMDEADMSLTVTIFAFTTSSLIITLCVVNGSSEVPQSQFYKINYVIGSIAYSANTVWYTARARNGFTFDVENLPAYLCIANTIVHLADCFLAYSTRPAAEVKK